MLFFFPLIPSTPADQNRNRMRGNENEICRPFLSSLRNLLNISAVAKHRSRDRLWRDAWVKVEIINTENYLISVSTYLRVTSNRWRHQLQRNEYLSISLSSVSFSRASICWVFCLNVPVSILFQTIPAPRARPDTRLIFKQNEIQWSFPSLRPVSLARLMLMDSCLPKSIGTKWNVNNLQDLNRVGWHLC